MKSAFSTLCTSRNVLLPLTRKNPAAWLTRDDDGNTVHMYVPNMQRLSYGVGAIALEDQLCTLYCTRSPAK
jgi:hypothetical protein